MWKLSIDSFFASPIFPFVVMRLISGTSNLPLASQIAEFLDIPLTECVVTRFKDGEIFVEVQENVRGEDVFVVQSTSSPANDHLMELLIIIDALRRGSARRITAVLPYFGYARQDRKTGPRTPISARLIANLLETAGADRILTLELHAGQIQGFFNIPSDNLMANPVFVGHVRDCQFANPLVISPDVGGVVRARTFAESIGSDLAIIDKRRSGPGKSEVMNVIGDVSGRDCIMIDDIVDSAGTLCNAADRLIAEGAKSVHAYICHAVLSEGARARIGKSKLDTLVVTNSINVRDGLPKNVLIVPVGQLFGRAVRNISDEKSVSSLFIV